MIPKGTRKGGIRMILKGQGQPWGVPKGMQVPRDRSDGDVVSCNETSSELAPKDLLVWLIPFMGCVRHPSGWELCCQDCPSACSCLRYPLILIHGG